MKNAEEITGWDFSNLTNCGRMKETPLPWDYAAIVKKYIPNAVTMLDMGTGGGEFLKTLAPLPAHTYATENYEPNVKIAEENLKSLGVQVVSGFKDDELPFKNDLFDLIINRHEYYEPSEVLRLLKPGGYFITQQVKGNCDMEILELLKVNTEIDFSDWSLGAAVNELEKNRFIIIQHNESTGYTEFSDIDALIAYIKVINWLVPDFTREKYKDSLLVAEDVIRMEGSFKCTLDRFYLLAYKPL
jgi:SAM-dependent methyltransferase